MGPLVLAPRVCPASQTSEVSSVRMGQMMALELSWNFLRLKKIALYAIAQTASAGQISAVIAFIG